MGLLMHTRLAELSTDELGRFFDGGRPTVALVPVGSVEPHGPHLPLATDTLIGEEAAARAVVRLNDQGISALVAPAVPYGVTDFAQGFPGALSIPEAALVAFLKAIVEGLLHTGFAHVCLISNHLEPAHDAAVRASIAGLAKGAASVASPLTRRHGRTLSDEYKSGACHAGRYETSLVLAARSDLVDERARARLAPLGISLSKGIQEGKTTFLAMGMTDAYTGAPGEASTEEGNSLYERLTDMIVIEASEGLAARTAENEA